jgi:hypothetical protein
MKRKIPSTQTRALLSKLEALADRGINGEKQNAAAKLERLKSRYDFTAPARNERDLFKGVFITTTQAEPVAPLDSGALDVASFVKWAIEARCKVPCLFKAGQLFAQTDRRCAKQLAAIATAVSDSFLKLWTQYKASPGANVADRGNFMLGLYEGMMEEARHGEAIPRRVEYWKPAKAKRKAVAHAAGLSLHPYSVAVDLGRQIRFCVPLEKVSHQLETIIRGEIPDTTNTP